MKFKVLKASKQKIFLDNPTDPITIIPSLYEGLQQVPTPHYPPVTTPVIC